MREPRVLNNHHGKLPPGVYYIGRGSPYGNPHRIEQGVDRMAACDLYESETLPGLDLEPLRGRDLLCFCHPARCHGHSIMARLYGGAWTDYTSWRPRSD